ncbi:hypothetical protein FGO68_gene15621 [Halteria grandinella]|uniref:PAS domain-containing protein n=1 Tax=Halteria grandinella TaxID=5974 RepID=A0A8J8T9X2_HALGN|nr:hypothetical protein FGO68_gene15621 [Halteria grandinella]
MREHEAPREVSVNSIPTDEINLPEEESTLKYRFLQLFIDKSIKKFPNSVSLHIQSSYFQSTKLKNEFKAMFELMKCEMMMNPSFQNKFFIFRHRIAVESILLAMSDSNVKQGERVDPKRIYQVERLTLKLQKLQYLTASSILAFWRELLQREIDPQVLRQRGGEILRTGEHLQLALDQINAADRENIKFLLGYCIFQKMVMSNESEAFAYFERAQNIMIRQTQVKKSGKGRSGSSIGKSVNGETPIFEVNERETYGDNTACAIVILSLSADSKGIIIHANDEVTRVLGYQRKNIIGCNVNIIQPKPFSGFHDRLLKRFLDSSKRTMINHSRQSFAKSAQDYLVPVQLLIKLYPMMTDKITVIGFIQALQKIDGLDGGSAKMESTVSSGLAQSYDTADQSLKYKIHHYIITDQDGNIQCVSEGLSRETGLNKRLFLGTDGFSTTFNIKKLFHVNFQLDESEEAMLNSPEGFETVLITDSVINDANVEFLAPEELEDMRRKKGSYAVNIMHRLIEVDANIPPVDYYRIVFLPPNVESIKQSKLSTQLKGGALSPNGSGAQKQLNSSAHEKSDGDSTGFNGSDPNNNFNNGSASISSTASGHSRSTGTSITMSKVIQEFKNSISRRQTPRHLIKMGRLLGLVIIATIAISCVDFNQKLLYVAESEDLCDVLSHSHQRHTQLIQLFMNIRSYVNLANSFEDKEYQSQNLTRIDRFQYIGYLIDKQSTFVRESHDLITQNRATFLSEELSKQEKRNENLYKLTQQMTVDSDVIPFRFAMNDYLNLILQLPNATENNLTMKASIIRGSPIVQQSLDAVNGTVKSYVPTLIQRDLYFMLTNGVRSLRVMNEEAVDYVRELTYDITENHFVGTFIVIMIIGLSVSSLSLALVVYQLMKTKKSKIEILNLIAMISLDDVKYAYDCCDHFIDRFENLDESLYTYQFDKRKNNDAQYKTTIEEGKADIKESQNALLLKEGARTSQELKLKQDLIKRGGTSNPKIAKGKQFDADTGNLVNHKDIDEDQNNASSQTLYSLLLKKNPMNYNEGISADEYYRRMYNFANDCMREQVLEVGTRKSDQVEKGKEGKQNIRGVDYDDSQEEEKESIGKKNKYNKNQGKESQIEKLKASAKIKKGKLGASKEEIIDRRQTVAKNRTQQKYLAKRFDVSNQSFFNEGSQDDINISQDHTHIIDDQDAEPIRGGVKGKHRHEEGLPTDTSFAVGGGHSERKEKNDSIEESSFTGNALNDESSGSKFTQLSLDQRKAMLIRPSRDDKKVFLRMILYNSASMLLFYVYFIYLYIFHEISLSKFENIQNFTPHIFDRYNSLFLSYELLREKIMNNRTAFSVLDLQVPEGQRHLMNGMEIDEYYHETSLETERDIQRMLLLSPSSIQPLLDLETTADSPNFCEATFGSIQIQGETGMLKMSRSEEKRLKKLRSEAYSLQIATVVAAIKAAQEGSVTTLQKLTEEKVNLESGDYDKRTVLHAACAAGQYQAVKYLLEAGVHPNSIDRWGATPFDDAHAFPEIIQILKDYGGKNGIKKAKNVTRGKMQLGDYQYKGYFSAYYGNITVLNDLRKLGWNVNGQDINGRTFLAVAASQGHLETVEFLINHGANMNIRDLRGNDALDDAMREGRSEVVKYLSDEALVKNYCFFYEDGLLDNGVKQVIGVLNKKFSDIQIAIKSANNYTQLLKLLVTPAQNSTKVQTGPIELFINVQELYLHKVTEEVTIALEETYAKYNKDYASVVEEVFFIFLAFQLFSLFFFRKRQVSALREDVMQTRGLLGLVPESFFKVHQNEVGNVIKIMQN